METKKVLTLIFSIIFVGAFAFCLTWGIINFNKVKDGMSGTGVYTQEDINNAYNDGYDTALKDKNEYTELIAGYRDTITTLNDNISQLNSQVNNLTNNNRDYANQVSKLNEQKSLLETQVNNLNTIKTNNEETISSLNTQITNLQSQVTTLTNSGENKNEQIAQLNTQISSLQNLVSQLQTTNNMNVDTITGLNVQIANLNNQISEMTLLSQNSTSQIANLNNKIAELQKSVTYYESYIAQLESGEQVVATFEYDGSVYNIQIVNKGSKLSVTTPTSTEYKIFNGWKVNGETIDLSTYTISQNTKIVADVTYKYDVVFKVDNDVYNSQVVVKNGIVTLPTNPTKTGYEFDGWSKNGVDVINNVQTILITENTTYQAVFTKLHNVTFKYEEETKFTQSIRNGNYSTAPTIESTDYKVFNGWKVNGNIVDVSTYKIVADTTFTADITYKYDVKFMVNNEVYDSQIVLKNGVATIPTEPILNNYHFNGWKIEDAIVNVAEYSIIEDTTFVADLTKYYNVSFKDDSISGMSGATTFNREIVDGEYLTDISNEPTKDYHRFINYRLNSKDGEIIDDITTFEVNSDCEIYRIWQKTFTIKFGSKTEVYDVANSNANIIIQGQKIILKNNDGTNLEISLVDSSNSRYKYFSLGSYDAGRYYGQSSYCGRDYINLYKFECIIATENKTFSSAFVYNSSSNSYRYSQLSSGNIYINFSNIKNIKFNSGITFTSGNQYQRCYEFETTLTGFKYNAYTFTLTSSNGSARFELSCSFSNNELKINSAKCYVNDVEFGSTYNVGSSYISIITTDTLVNGGMLAFKRV